jgi:hypothetical protein
MIDIKREAEINAIYNRNAIEEKAYELAKDSGIHNLFIELHKLKEFDYGIEKAHDQLIEAIHIIYWGKNVGIETLPENIKNLILESNKTIENLYFSLTFLHLLLMADTEKRTQKNLMKKIKKLSKDVKNNFKAMENTEEQS